MSFGADFSEDKETKAPHNECNPNSRLNLRAIESGSDPLSVYKSSSGGVDRPDDRVASNEEFCFQKDKRSEDEVGLGFDDMKSGETNSMSLDNLSLLEPFQADTSLASANKEAVLEDPNSAVFQNDNSDDNFSGMNKNSRINSAKGDISATKKATSDDSSGHDDVSGISGNNSNNNNSSGRVSGLLSSFASTVTQNISFQIQNALRETTSNMMSNTSLKNASKNNSESLKWNDVLCTINRSRSAYVKMNIKMGAGSLEGSFEMDESESEAISKSMNLSLHPGEKIVMFYKECGISTQYGLPNPIYGSFLVTNFRIILAPLYEKGDDNKLLNIIRRYSLLWMYKSGFFHIPISCIASYSVNAIHGFSSQNSSISDLSFKNKNTDTNRGGMGAGLTAYGSNYFNGYPCILDISTKDLRDIQVLIVQTDRERRFLLNHLDSIANEAVPTNFFSYISYREKANKRRLFEFDIIQEYERMGLRFGKGEFPCNDGVVCAWDEGFPLRVSTVNSKYELCNSYPNTIIVPRDVSDSQLVTISCFRSKNRIPILCWTNLYLKCTLWRSSQPKSAFKRCFEDELFITTISKFYKGSGDNKNFTIYDARPKLNAYANKATGAGFENIDYYPYCELEFLNIENIHKVRDSWNKMVSVTHKVSNYDSYCSCDKNSKHHLNKAAFEFSQRKEYTVDEVNSYLSFMEKTFHGNSNLIGINLFSDIDSTGWYDLISMLLLSSNKIVHKLLDSKGVLVHCSDGWDRTSQLTALSMMCIDPYYRTIKGFMTLIEKEFIISGHKFHSRCGTLGLNSTSEHENERSPIFIQWLDCVYQCILQFPHEFQFNSNLLIFIAEQLNSSLFGNFFCNNEYERTSISSKELTLSLWDTILQYVFEYPNLDFKTSRDGNSFSNNDELGDSFPSHAKAAGGDTPLGINLNVFYHSGFLNEQYKHRSEFKATHDDWRTEFSIKSISRDNALILDSTSIKISPWLQFWFKFSPICLRTI